MTSKTLAELIHRHPKLVEEYLPSGAGFDAGTRIVEVSPTKIVLETDYHHMTDTGHYDGWTTHRVSVHATFDGHTVRVTGKNRNQTKDYIADTFRVAMLEQQYVLEYLPETCEYQLKVLV